MFSYLVVSAHLKNISQIGSCPQIEVKIKAMIETTTAQAFNTGPLHQGTWFCIACMASLREPLEPRFTWAFSPKQYTQGELYPPISSGYFTPVTTHVIKQGHLQELHCHEPSARNPLPCSNSDAFWWTKTHPDPSRIGWNIFTHQSSYGRLRR